MLKSSTVQRGSPGSCVLGTTVEALLVNYSFNLLKLNKYQALSWESGVDAVVY